WLRTHISARLLYHIADALADDLFPFLQKVEENLELISDKVFDERQSVAVQLSSQRRTIGDLRRIISPLRRLATDSASKLQRFSGHEDLSEYFDDVTDHVEKAWEILEGTKETIEIYKDTDNILSLELTNKVLVILTIVTVLTIPATVVGTLYGMNIPMPGSLVPEPATFLGIYTTFWIAIAASVLPALALLFFFRRRGWL
ncbi:MAG: magnesium transporter, partial [Thaumarchaeota archaeon]|nr:magnesium transporter [Nitrososphaerota archaeon]